MLVFHAHSCLLIACLRTHCMLAYSSLHTLAYSLHACILIACLHTTHCTCIITLAYLHLHTLTLTCILCTWMLSLFHLHWGTYSVHVAVQVWWKCQCVRVSIEVSVFKGFPGRTLRNAFGKNALELANALARLFWRHGKSSGELLARDRGSSATTPGGRGWVPTSQLAGS